MFLKKIKNSNLKILQCKAEQKRYVNIYMKN